MGNNQKNNRIKSEMKKFSVLAAAAFVGSFTQARMLQDESDKPKCCTLLSGDPNGERTKHRIC